MQESTLVSPTKDVENMTKAYLMIERKVINLMLNHKDVIAELVQKNINPDFFDDHHQALVQAIYYVHGEGEKLLTDEYFRNLLIKQGGKGDISVAMQVAYECRYGVHHSNNKNDLDMLVNQLSESYIHRQAVKFLGEFNEDVQKLEYIEATRKYADKLQSITKPTTQKFRLKMFDTIKSETVEFLYPEKIPLGMLTIMAGIQGEGKSSITLDLAARVTTGAPMPSTTIPTPKGSVIIANCEDPETSVIRNRLDQIQHIDLSKIAYLEQDAELIDLDKNLRELEEMIVSLGDCKLIVLDPLSAYMGKVNTFVDAEVRRVLGPVCKLAKKLNVSIVGIMHLSKDKAKGLLDRILASTAFTATARSVFMIGADRDGRKLFSHIKSNVSKLSGSIEYNMVESCGSVRVQWDQKVIFDDPEKLFTLRKPIENAQEWLEGELKDGPEDSKILFNKAQVQGYTQKTLYRAKKLMGIESKKKGLNNGWEWKL